MAKGAKDSRATCPYCPFIAPNQDGLHRHIQSAHPQVGGYGKNGKGGKGGK